MIQVRLSQETGDGFRDQLRIERQNQCELKDSDTLLLEFTSDWRQVTVCPTYLPNRDVVAQPPADKPLSCN